MLFTPDDADAVLYGKCQDLLNGSDLKHFTDIEIIRNGRSWMYNKIFIYLHYPFLGEDLKDSELVIFEETLPDGVKDIRNEETAGGDLEEIMSLPFPNSHDNSSSFSELCPVCGKVFKEKEKFKDHCGRNQSRESLECRVCHRSFCSLKKLKQHQRIHTEGNQYACNLCFKNFKHRRNLSDHLKQHSNKSEFKCSKCFKTFSCVQNLKRHERRIYCSP